MTNVVVGLSRLDCHKNFGLVGNSVVVRFAWYKSDTLGDLMTPRREPFDGQINSEAIPNPGILPSQESVETVQGANPAPVPEMLHRITHARRLRDRFFPAGLFADPAWDMLLDLAEAEGEGRDIYVSSLCIAAAVPETTALRWIARLVDLGLFVRKTLPDDPRRIYVTLTDKSRDMIWSYFAALEAHHAQVI